MPSANHEIPLSKARRDGPGGGNWSRPCCVRGRLSIGPVQEQFEQMVAAPRRPASRGGGQQRNQRACTWRSRPLGVGPGDEVITTPFSFIASSNLHPVRGARQPVFVDICPQDDEHGPGEGPGRGDARGPRRSSRSRHFGKPGVHGPVRADRGPVRDPAGGGLLRGPLGARSRGEPAAASGRIGVFGFYPNKQITTGEGGMIVTRRQNAWRNLCVSMRSQGRPVPRARGATDGGADGIQRGPRVRGSATSAWGTTNRLSEINAAIGVAQMKRLPEIIERRQRVARSYMDRLMTHTDLVLPHASSPESVMSWFVFVVRLAAGYKQGRARPGDRRDAPPTDVGREQTTFRASTCSRSTASSFGFKLGDFPIAERRGASGRWRCRSTTR